MPGSQVCTPVHVYTGLPAQLLHQSGHDSMPALFGITASSYRFPIVLLDEGDNHNCEYLMFAHLLVTTLFPHQEWAPGPLQRLVLVN